MKLDKEAHPTARRVHRRGMIKKANWLAGPKVAGLISTESVLESNLAYCAMIDPRVKSIEPQPVTFDLLSGM